MYIYAVLGIYLLVDYSKSPTLPPLAWKFADIPNALLTLFQLLSLDGVRFPSPVPVRKHARMCGARVSAVSPPLPIPSLLFGPLAWAHTKLGVGQCFNATDPKRFCFHTLRLQWFQMMTEYTTIVSVAVGDIFFISWVTQTTIEYPQYP